ncbi:hypothetical protein AMECASPLE_026678 [Ameca splendens]|uniref:Uncharacterized protein n=1 Tax=Ameca splendens TaxID=208324 RepID=A0ABV0XHY2_9TELE
MLNSSVVLQYFYPAQMDCQSSLHLLGKRETKQMRSNKMRRKREETKNSTFSCKHKNTFSSLIVCVCCAGISSRPSSGNSLCPSSASGRHANSDTKWTDREVQQEWIFLAPNAFMLGMVLMLSVIRTFSLTGCQDDEKQKRS